ncbi:ferredoxin [Streptomonospora alba]|uniref:Ferredoxin n=1 Tax=Streptomonospora alba TaxID=183763 RepID=A0A0C2FLP4_9ACTN|nr:ferredoxin [Streptomonospora alba]KII00205.1 ferredoxin [Streptomonospora alba]
MKIAIHRNRCIAVGNCAALAPEVFDQSDEDGTVVVLDAAPPDHRHEQVREAALRCPSSAIALHGETPAHDG